MIIGKHNLIIKYTSEQIARRLGNALVAPVVAYVPEGNLNPPTGHMRFPGTITLPHEYFVKLIEFAARSFKLHGFKDIVFIGDHGSYQDDMKVVADQLSRFRCWGLRLLRRRGLGGRWQAREFDP